MFANLSLARILQADAAACLAMGLGLALLPGPVARVLALPEGLVLWAGALLFPAAALMIAASLRPGKGLLALVVAGNAAWVLASLALVPAGWVTPNAFGTGAILLQAGVAALFTWAEARGLRAEARRAA
ncbi:MAG: hypothetical protein CVT80_16260 [Alphaproteobacteria bacterium HGW-Alphaproteobacteria-2]|nr:MAG: hypothetical protein CVT80_16260 [Alphaproteobacteria bacterium HGW-Alphaproteobacteria-2]